MMASFSVFPKNPCKIGRLCAGQVPSRHTNKSYNLSLVRGNRNRPRCWARVCRRASRERGVHLPSPILLAQSISKSFEGVRALKGVSFELLPGEVHALIGENGAGKSTLIKIMTGAVAADSGTLSVAGRAVAHNTP